MQAVVEARSGGGGRGGRSAGRGGRGGADQFDGRRGPSDGSPDRAFSQGGRGGGRGFKARPPRSQEQLFDKLDRLRAGSKQASACVIILGVACLQPA